MDATLPLGKVYVPDSSYREMTEWVLPPALHAGLRRWPSGTSRPARWPSGSSHSSGPGDSGGTSRRAYPESDEMYARMLGISRRLAVAATRRTPIPTTSTSPGRELYRGQCNCPYWHGAFGGLYLPHLRNAIYRSLIAAHNALDDAEGKTGPRVSLEIGDFNLDARQEVRLENDRLIAFVRPASGRPHLRARRPARR